GQKCSACSRAIVDELVYDVFIERIREKVAALTVGDPSLNPNMGPVINDAALKKIVKYIEIGKSEGRLIAGGHAIDTPDSGYFLALPIFADVAPNARL